MPLSTEELEVMWCWVVENTPQLAALCRRMKGRSLEYDDCWDEMLERMPRLWELHSDCEGKIFAHLKWYMFKKMCSRWDRDPLGWRRENIEDSRGVSENLDDKLEVRFILEQLSPEDGTLLHMRHILELTWQEIGDRIGVSRCTARLMCIAALGRAHEIFDHRREDEQP